MPKLYAGLDVSDLSTSICILDEGGKIVFEGDAETTPAAIMVVLRPYKRALKSVGLESGTKSLWLYRGLLKAKSPVLCLDARHAHSALSAGLNKTDRNDALGLAQLLVRGIYREAYVKSDDAQRIKTLLALRRSVLRKTTDLRLMVRMTRKIYGTDICDVASEDSDTDAEQQLQLAWQGVDGAIAAMKAEMGEFDRMVKELADGSTLCRRLMTVPGVGPITALIFTSAIDDPTRFDTSRDVAAYFGLTPRVFRSGMSMRSGGISLAGDESVRGALCHAAHILLAKSRSTCRLRQWGLRLKAKKGRKIAYVACARKLAVLLHHLWITGEEFDPAR